MVDQRWLNGVPTAAMLAHHSASIDHNPTRFNTKTGGRVCTGLVVLDPCTVGGGTCSGAQLQPGITISQPNFLRGMRKQLICIFIFRRKSQRWNRCRDPWPPGLIYLAGFPGPISAGHCPPTVPYRASPGWVHTAPYPGTGPYPQCGIPVIMWRWLYPGHHNYD